jgi:putative transposase
VLIIGRRHLDQVLRAYLAHYNAERPHRSLALATPAGQPPAARGSPPEAVLRRDLLGGLIHEYAAAA